MFTLITFYVTSPALVNGDMDVFSGEREYETDGWKGQSSKYCPFANTALTYLSDCPHGHMKSPL